MNDTMTILDEDIKPIKIECLRYCGLEFEFQDTSEYYGLYGFNWSESFEKKKTLFGYKLKSKGSTIPNEMIEYETKLKHLPSGITYEKRTVEQDSWLDECNPSLKYVNYSTKFILHVSESFSQSIMQQYDGSRIVVWNYPELETALDFKQKILSMHSNILEPLFTNGVLKNLCLTTTGFTNFDCQSYPLSKVKMKPIQSNTQLLGLMIAICEYSERYIPKNEIWSIEKENNGKHVVVHKYHLIDISAQQSLRDW